MHCGVSSRNRRDRPSLTSLKFAIRGVTDMHVLTNGAGLELEWIWHHDRYRHVIYEVEGESREPIIESVEGDHTQIWPVSPPLQQLSPSTGPRPTMWGLGMAGAAHWSASVEGYAGTGIRSRWVFDFACRLARPEPKFWLGSTLRLLVPVQDQNRRSCLISGRRLYELSLPPEFQETTLDWDGNCLRISACGVRVVTGPTTVRWQYEIGQVGPLES